MSADTGNEELKVVEGDVAEKFEDVAVATTIFDTQERVIDSNTDSNTDSTASGSKKNNLIQFVNGSNKKVYFIIENLIAKFRLHAKNKIKGMDKKAKDNKEKSDERSSDDGNEK